MQYLNSFVTLLGVIQSRRVQQSQHQVFKTAAQLRLQVCSQVLPSPSSPQRSPSSPSQSSPPSFWIIFIITAIKTVVANIIINTMIPQPLFSSLHNNFQEIDKEGNEIPDIPRSHLILCQRTRKDLYIMSYTDTTGPYILSHTNLKQAFALFPTGVQHWPSYSVLQES